MISGADAARRHVDFARIGFGMSNELGHRVDRHLGIHLYGKGVAANAPDRHDVADKIELEIFVECCVTRVRKRSQQKRIAIRGCIHDGLRGYVAAGTWPVLNEELLTKALRQPWPYQSCHDVVATTRGKADNDTHRPRRIGLRPRDS